MTTTTFDTYEFVKRLESAGCTESQAKVHVQILSEALKSKELATKTDIKEVKQEIKEVKRDIKILIYD